MAIEKYATDARIAGVRKEPRRMRASCARKSMGSTARRPTGNAGTRHVERPRQEPRHAVPLRPRGVCWGVCVGVQEQGRVPKTDAKSVSDFLHTRTSLTSGGHWPGSVRALASKRPHCCLLAPSASTLNVCARAQHSPPQRPQSPRQRLPRARPRRRRPRGPRRGCQAPTRRRRGP